MGRIVADVTGRLPLDLPERLRRWGLTVVEVPGWQTRGAATLRPTVLLRHHTAGPPTGEAPSLPTVVHGRPDLTGPLSQFFLARSGTVHLVASGKANHAGRGRWADADTNLEALGTECENDGHQPFTPAQLAAWDLLDACVLTTIGQPASHLCAHREWALPAGRKVDPHDMAMDVVRDQVARLMRLGPNASAAVVAPRPITWTPLEDHMRVAPVTVRLDDHGAGWADVPDAVAAHAWSEVNGADPVGRGYGPAVITSTLQVGSAVRVVVQGGAPRGTVDVRVFEATAA